MTTTLERTSSLKHENQVFTWHGSGLRAEATLSAMGNRLCGHFRIGDQAYEIRPTIDGHRLILHRFQALKPCGVGLAEAPVLLSRRQARKAGVPDADFADEASAPRKKAMETKPLSEELEDTDVVPGGFSAEYPAELTGVVTGADGNIHIQGGRNDELSWQTDEMSVTAPSIAPPRRHKQSLLLVYSQGAAHALASEILLHAQNAVDLANVAYSNSGIPVRLDLAGVVIEAFDDRITGREALGRLTDPGDGSLDGVHTLRTEHRADLVALIANGLTDVCGMAWTEPADPAKAFSVVEMECVYNYALTHEIGHNQGCGHDHSQPQFPGLPPHARGLCLPGEFRTIMATECGAPTPRINFFSSPGRTWGGVPLGRPATSPEPADNASRIAETADRVAGHRWKGRRGEQ